MATSEKLVLTAHDLADILGICLPKAYDLMRSKGFPAVQLTPRPELSHVLRWMNG